MFLPKFVMSGKTFV